MPTSNLRQAVRRLGVDELEIVTKTLHLVSRSHVDVHLLYDNALRLINSLTALSSSRHINKMARCLCYQVLAERQDTVALQQFYRYYTTNRQMRHFIAKSCQQLRDDTDFRECLHYLRMEVAQNLGMYAVPHHPTH